MSEPLQEQFVESDSFRLRRWFPWINLFRAFRLAIGLRVVILGMAACLLISVGEYLISWMPFSPHMDQPQADEDAAEEQGERLAEPRLPRTTWPWQPGFLGASDPDAGVEDESYYTPRQADESSLGRTDGILRMAREPWGAVGRSTGYGSYILWPARTVIEPAAVLFSSEATWSDAAVACCKLIWALLVWSVLAVAMVRIVVLEFGGRESPSLTNSIGFSLAQLPAAIGAVILPTVALAGLYLVCRIGGWFAHIEWLQPFVAAFWIIGLVCGLGIAVILMLLAAGWPLMVCTMAVDRGDSFEGFTRAFSYVFGRPFYALWLLLVATLYGSIVFVFVVAVASSAAHLAETAAGGHDGIDEIAALKPPLLGGSPVDVEVRDQFEPPIEPETADSPDEEPDDESEEGDEEGVVARSIAGFWLKLWATLCVGFATSFFWTSSGIVYLLLRKSVDATPLDEIHGLDSKTEPPTLPLSGMAAADLRERQSMSDTEPPVAGGPARPNPEA